MNKAWGFALFAGLAAISAGCEDPMPWSNEGIQALGNARQQQLAARLAKEDKSPNPKIEDAKPVAKWIMPVELREISGLVLTPDGRLLTHGDENAIISVIDPRKGLYLKQFTVGGGMKGDFESITMAGNDIYLLSSKSLLLRFQEGDDGADVPYSSVDMGLGKDCEFESMVYQSDSNWLVLPCKNAFNKAYAHELVIYRWKLNGPDSTRLSMITIPFAQLIGANGWKNLHPSDITIDPTTGNFVMVASHEKALIEMTRTGELVRSGPLPPGHNQPEGVAITKDSILIVSDEANKTPAAITLYRWHPSLKPDSIQ